MCRYGVKTYKSHFACFKCRKSFKRRLLSDISDNEMQESVPAKCPDCGDFMANMGLDFKALTKKNIKAWVLLADLYSVGITFHSCGCSGPGYIPKDTESLISFLNETKEHYASNLRFWLNYEEPSNKKERDNLHQKNSDYVNKLPYSFIELKKTENKDKAIEYWTEKIESIEQNINNLRLK